MPEALPNVKIEQHDPRKFVAASVARIVYTHMGAKMIPSKRTRALTDASRSRVRVW